ncbi:uncharacterized protein LOC131062669 [Cryptomeria japonica]|uniref:uncharacterized protein LOC131062669 n=1 Tax=Cryptomeria japonica TaxID=3369 RepID=UPI0025AC9FEB|nr:uncharacterized protein LOC131062669 [Cryptomeria japonica]
MGAAATKGTATSPWAPRPPRGPRPHCGCRGHQGDRNPTMWAVTHTVAKAAAWAATHPVGHLTEKAHTTFDKFKKIMSSCPVLAIPDFSKPFELQCDASGEGVGAVLMQDKHPIVFESRK